MVDYIVDSDTRSLTLIVEDRQGREHSEVLDSEQALALATELLEELLQPEPVSVFAGEDKL